MKAIVNIGLRMVRIEYSIDATKFIGHHKAEDKYWVVSQKKLNSKTIQCEQTLFFNDCDEWKSIKLFDGRIIDFHYDYEVRSEFDNKKDWGSYIFQGYLVTEGKDQTYDNQLVENVKIVF